MLFYLRLFFIMIMFLGFKEPASAADWDDLPPEIWVHVVSKMKNEKDVCSLAQVNKNLNQVTKNPAAWEGAASKYGLKLPPESTLIQRVREAAHNQRKSEQEDQDMSEGLVGEALMFLALFYL